LLPFEPTAHTASTKAHQLLRDVSLPRSKQKMRNIKLECNDNWIEAANSRIVLDVTGRHDLFTGPRQCMKDLLQYSQESVKASFWLRRCSYISISRCMDLQHRTITKVHLLAFLFTCFLRIVCLADSLFACTRRSLRASFSSCQANDTVILSFCNISLITHAI
jgi:hypothetical protein